MKKIESNFAFLCDQAFFCSNGKLNIIGVFKEIYSNRLPMIHPQMYVVSNTVIKGKGEYKL